MRPLKLHLKNFGPYVDSTIDFTKFDNAPLFLITGKTGSGKTTIFDAMCYALFNETSNKDRDATKLRSDFASNEATIVEFEFEHQQKHYYIKREPRQKLSQNKREKNPTVALTYMDDLNDELITLTKIKDVQSFIDELLHLDAKQFTKVVLLPQGQFRNFLAADSNAKEAVLRNLFGSEIFSQWTAEMKNKAKLKRKAYDKQHQQLEMQMQQVEAIEALDPNEWLELFEKRASQKQTELEQQTKKAGQLKQELSELEKQKVKQEELAKDLVELANLTEKLAYFEETKEERKKLAQEIEQLKWAQSQDSTAKLYEKTTTEVADVKNGLAHEYERKEALSKSKEELAKKAVEIAQKVKEKEKLEYEAKQLEEKLVLYMEVSDLGTKSEQLAKKATQKHSEEETQKQKLEQSNQEYDSLQLKLSKLADSTTKLSELNAKISELQVRSEALTSDKEQLKQLSDRKEELLLEANKLTKQDEKLAHKRSQKDELVAIARQKENSLASYYIGKAAKSLRPNEPCPVCGSTVHPKKADISDVKITEDEVKDARQKANKAEQEVVALETKLTENKKQNAKAQKLFERDVKKLLAKYDKADLNKLEDYLTNEVAQKEEALQTLKKEAKKAKTDDKDLKELKPKLKNLEEKIVSQKENLEATKKAYQALLDEKKELDIRCEEKRAQLPSKYATKKEAKAKVDTLNKQVKSYAKEKETFEQEQANVSNELVEVTTRIAEKEQKQRELKEEQQIQKEKLKESCQKQQLTLDQLMELLENLPTLAKKEKTLADQRKEESELKTKEEYLSEKTKDKEVLDLAKLSENLQQTRQESETSERYVHELSLRQEDEKKTYTKVKNLLEEQRDALTQLSELQELVNVISGDNDKKLGFERYILQTYLQEVLITANIRLDQLTNGRYELRLSEVKGSYAKNTGLELDIYDDNAGKVRSVHTLSGGESFLAALALALALGEVIQAKSGGVKIDALFVDEGFGSLDQEALQGALETLHTIEGKERMVGIISHVTELQESLPYQLQVKTDGEHSSLNYVLPD